jgi:hypothetical protein
VSVTNYKRLFCVLIFAKDVTGFSFYAWCRSQYIKTLFLAEKVPKRVVGRLFVVLRDELIF